MKLTLYRCPSGAYLVVPDCLQIPLEAVRLYGPIRVGPPIESDDYPMPAVWEVVMAEIDALSFAVVNPALGKHLLGLDRQEAPTALA